MNRVFKYLSFLFCLLALYCGCSCAGLAKRDKAKANLEQVALSDSILLYFQQERFGKIIDHFDNKLKMQLREEQLELGWKQLNTQFGKYTANEFYGTEKISGIGDRVVYKCNFGSQKLYFQLIFGKDNQLIGIYFNDKLN